jgi:hypothetical protein
MGCSSKKPESWGTLEEALNAYASGAQDEYVALMKLRYGKWEIQASEQHRVENTAQKKAGILTITDTRCLSYSWLGMCSFPMS